MQTRETGWARDTRRLVHDPRSLSGTFAGASVALQGSNDGVTWTALSPPALTSAGTFRALLATEIYQYGDVVVTGGGGTTALAVSGF
jgi:hypothetical protein